MFYYIMAMEKDLPILEYVTALESKYAEQVEVNRQLLQTVAEQMVQISRLENRLRAGKAEAMIDDLLSLASCTGEA